MRSFSSVRSLLLGSGQGSGFIRLTIANNTGDRRKLLARARAPFIRNILKTNQLFGI
jgi:hypothetical protein